MNITSSTQALVNRYAALEKSIASGATEKRAELGLVERTLTSFGVKLDEFRGSPSGRADLLQKARNEQEQAFLQAAGTTNTGKMMWHTGAQTHRAPTDTEMSGTFMRDVSRFGSNVITSMTALRSIAPQALKTTLEASGFEYKGPSASAPHTSTFARTFSSPEGWKLEQTVSAWHGGDYDGTLKLSTTLNYGDASHTETLAMDKKGQARDDSNYLLAYAQQAVVQIAQSRNQGSTELQERKGLLESALLRDGGQTLKERGAAINEQINTLLFEKGRPSDTGGYVLEDKADQRRSERLFRELMVVGVAEQLVNRHIPEWWFANGKLDLDKILAPS